MPTYTINMQGDPAANAWAEGASALAKAFTPDYEAQAKGQVMAAQADAAYARSANSLASRDKTLAETVGIEWEQSIRENLWNQFQNGDLTREDVIQLGAEAGIAMDPTASLGDLGSVNQVLASNEEGMTPEGMVLPQMGAGMEYGDTYTGFKDTQTNANQQWLAEQAAAAAEAEAQREFDREQYIWEGQNEPLSLSENEIIVVPEGHPAWTPENGGVIVGQRSVGRTEQILEPGGTEPVATGPGFNEAEAPELETWQEGREKVTGYYDPTDERANENGYVVTARGPLTSADGREVLSPTDQAFAEADALTLNQALANGQGAADALTSVEQLMALIQQGTPTGFWTNATLPLRQAAAGMGFGDEKKLAQIETVTSGLGNRVMARIQDTKGAVSNAEMDYFRKISASIGNSPAGNLMLLEGERRVHARNVELAALANSMRGEDGEAIAAALEQYKRDNPIWKPEEIENINLMVPDEDLGYAIGGNAGTVDETGVSGTTSSGSTWEVVE